MLRERYNDQAAAQIGKITTDAPAVLTDETFLQALNVLSKCDSDLARILKDWGSPPRWAREPGFPTLLRIILEQQVSLASAKATYKRLLEAVSPLTPQRFLDLDDDALKSIGFSRQKTAYGRHLAQLIADGELDLASVNAMDDETARAELTKVKGIGIWTANIYLLAALGRPDIWPSRDLALAMAVQKAKGLDSCPKPDELEGLSIPWQPWRSVAARLLWHFYRSSAKNEK
ncbi:MAG: DNA-3-methyladenine glycosylase 2 family protein [Deltaproteobacteria bacterium]|nr:DNA-3-methyladenine glycosylase 2 family protein [Deltaproteobacteria bacterium]